MQNDLPKGFKIAAVEANFKKSGRLDLGMIFSDKPCVVAALFTRNIFCAAPVKICREILQTSREARVVIGNSGQANACTGEAGLKNCREIQNLAARELGVDANEILLISTGVIGAKFDMDKWRKSLPELVKKLGENDARDFTDAIHTTDSFLKYAAREITLSRGVARLTIMAKGAGMICPNMATMLCVCLTDVSVAPAAWQDMFTKAADLTFNRVSVDGDTSTNDTILGLANGASGVPLDSDDDREIFYDELLKTLGEVAYMLVRDGEGAKRVMHINVSGAATDGEAEKVARAVGQSQLVKTAVYGGDANWGRIINAVGYSGVSVNPAEVSLTLCGIERFRRGQPVNDDCEAQLTEALQKRDINIDIVLGTGNGNFTFLASDLGHEYVTLNSDYRS